MEDKFKVKEKKAKESKEKKGKAAVDKKVEIDEKEMEQVHEDGKLTEE